MISYIGTVYPSKRKFTQFYRVALVDTRSELRGLMGQSDCRAGCLTYRNPHLRKRMGILYFLRNDVTDADVVHECVHAAIEFVEEHVMPQSSFKNRYERERHYTESVATATDAMFVQACKMIRKTLRQQP